MKLTQALTKASRVALPALIAILGLAERTHASDCGLFPVSPAEGRCVIIDAITGKKLGTYQRYTVGENWWNETKEFADDYEVTHEDIRVVLAYVPKYASFSVFAQDVSKPKRPKELVFTNIEGFGELKIGGSVVVKCGWQ